MTYTPECIDGSQKAGRYICSTALGAKCETSWYINWPISDGPHFCAQKEIECPAVGAELPGEILCGGPAGPVVPGKQKCQNGDCGSKYWSLCWGDKPCPK
ncbi:MAG: hypothetical protein EXR79_08860 [Myxococcales bacterium]|nr:hypothetical protein [Myxococcales bacterium]